MELSVGASVTPNESNAGPASMTAARTQAMTTSRKAVALSSDSRGKTMPPSFLEAGVLPASRCGFMSQAASNHNYAGRCQNVTGQGRIVGRWDGCLSGGIFFAKLKHLKSLHLKALPGFSNLGGLTTAALSI